MNNTTSNTTSNGDKNFEEEIGALWKRKSKNGLTYLAGHVKIEDELGTEKMVKVVLFSNKKKTNEKQPDFRMYVSKALPRQDEEASSAPAEAPQESSEAEDLL
jgi:uncharacterized protein (DUF736 family)|tara:strand:+ start:302 stop:610 length:309 start_codon:yes stop_codon:yes gene_type:complete